MPQAPATRRRWFQFGSRELLVATFWAAVFCSALVALNRLWYHEFEILESEELGYVVVEGVLFASLSAAIGSLFGRAWSGAAGGLILYALWCVVMVAWQMYALKTWGI